MLCKGEAEAQRGPHLPGPREKVARAGGGSQVCLHPTARTPGSGAFTVSSQPRACCAGIGSKHFATGGGGGCSKDWTPEAPEPS